MVALCFGGRVSLFDDNSPLSVSCVSDDRCQASSSQRIEGVDKEDNSNVMLECAARELGFGQV